MLIAPEARKTTAPLRKAFKKKKVFSDGHGKWYNPEEYDKSTPKWLDGANHQYFWPEE